MIKINVVAVGKVKEKYFEDGIKEYSKRLSRFCTFNVIEVQEENRTKVSAGDIAVIKKIEGERILPYLKGKIFAMAIEGKTFSSESFAKKISSCSLDNSEITFVIGGSYGLADEIKSKAELGVLGMLPSTILAIGYFDNFIKPICEHICSKDFSLCSHPP